MRLRTKLTLVYSVVSIIFVVSLMLIINLVVKYEFHNYTINRTNEIINSLVTRIVQERKTSNNFTNIALEAQEVNLYITITDENGNVLYQAHKKGHSNKQKHYSETFALTSDNVRYGNVLIEYYGDNYLEQDLEYLDTINKVLILSGVGLILISIIVSFLIATRISTPIKEIKSQSLLIKEGNYSNFKIKNNTLELVELSNTINDLSTKLKEQEEIKKRLARDYTHELKTPLAALLSNFEAMIDNVIEITPQKLESLRKEILRINQLVNQVNDIVIGNQNLTLNCSYFNITELFNDLISNSMNYINSKNLILYMELEDINVFCDRNKISQVFVNLLTNAIKYTFSGYIKIKLYKELEDFVFIVEDSGIGISKEDLPKIFNDLYRADDSRSKNIEGFGIGLAIVKRIVELHEGTITVLSEQNIGSKFIVRIKHKVF